MSKAELNIKRKIRSSKIQKIVLTSLYAAGVLSMAVLAPNTLSLLKHLNKNNTRSLSQKYSVNNAIKRLRDRGLVKWEKNKNGVFLRLTHQGEQAIELFERKEFKIKKPKKWDGKWRIIIFDIRETKRGARDKFRKTLQLIGFLKLQNSVWVYPYNCEDLMTLLKADYKIGKDILYIIADSIENDQWVKEYFDLPKS